MTRATPATRGRHTSDRAVVPFCPIRKVHARLLGAALLLGPLACAQTPPPVAAASSPRAEPAPRPCGLAAERYRAALADAAEGCLSDEGCEPLDSCHAVVRNRGAGVAPLRRALREACQADEDSRAEVECAPRAVRCVAGRCLRF